MFSTEQLHLIAQLIGTQVQEFLSKQLKDFKSQPEKVSEKAMITRGQVAKRFGVTADTISNWIKTGILDSSTYLLINKRFKFFPEKIDELLNKQREGTWEPNRKFI